MRFWVQLVTKGHDVDNVMSKLASYDRVSEYAAEEFSETVSENLKPKYVVIRKVSGYPGANRRKARKLGLLRMQKFRSRTRAIEAAGAEEPVK